MTEAPGTVISSIDQPDLSQWAQEDAQNDNAKGAELHFPSFDGRIQFIIQHYTATITKGFVIDFQSRTKHLREEFTDIAGRLVGDPKTYVDDTINHVNTAIASAENNALPKLRTCNESWLNGKAGSSLDSTTAS